jgi:predicted ATPase
MALGDWESASALEGWVFFDRGLIDAAAGLQHLTGEQVLGVLGQSYRYHRRVFMVPPWPEIYVIDPERRHGFDAALAEYSRLLEACPSIGYETVVLPKVGVLERADLVVDALKELP